MSKLHQDRSFYTLRVFLVHSLIRILDILLVIRRIDENYSHDHSRSVVPVRTRHTSVITSLVRHKVPRVTRWVVRYVVEYVLSRVRGGQVSGQYSDEYFVESTLYDFLSGPFVANLGRFRSLGCWCVNQTFSTLWVSVEPSIYRNLRKDYFDDLKNSHWPMDTHDCKSFDDPWTIENESLNLSKILRLEWMFVDEKSFPCLPEP